MSKSRLATIHDRTAADKFRALIAEAQEYKDELEDRGFEVKCVNSIVRLPDSGSLTIKKHVEL